MSELRVKTYVLGMVSTNCYIIYHEQTRDAVIIDPADNAAYILNKCYELKVEPKAVLLTHGHFDHILAVKDIIRAFPVKLYAGEKEAELLFDPRKNISANMNTGGVSLKPDVRLKDGDVLELLGFTWKVIATPGHTPGSVCYYIESEEVMFTGDTLFQDSYGRCDLYGGDFNAIADSIRNKLFTLPDDVMVYPGHGEPTVLGHEKEYNMINRSI